jgi:tagatose-1,6-bisphosphate aldolase non-catalytic subunit AgaZ/GatZ
MLGVGPMSKACVDSAIQISAKCKLPLMLIASRRQIDSEKMGGGYVNNWTTEEFASYVSTRIADDKLWICRDHGGPWQNDKEKEASLSLEQAMESAKQSFEVDIASGFKVIHLDPSIDFESNLDIESALDRLFELYEFCWETAQRYNKKILFEIGTEEQSGSTNTPLELIYTLERIEKFCKKNNIHKPTFVVVQTGTRVLETRNVGSFSSSLRVKGELAPEIQIPQMVEITQKYQVLIKQHNTDYLPTEDLCWMPNLKINAANVAPEFGVAETRSLLTLLEKYKLHSERDEFLEIAFNSGKWKKWMTQNTDATDMDKAIIAGHYVFASAEFLELRQRLENELALSGIDLHQELVESLSASIMRYVTSFRLRGR